MMSALAFPMSMSTMFFSVLALLFSLHSIAVVAELDAKQADALLSVFDALGWLLISYL